MAITNRRLLACDDGQVTFRWKDYQRGNRQRLMTLDAVEFIRRFLLHVLPRGFQRRHLGSSRMGGARSSSRGVGNSSGRALWHPLRRALAVDATATASMPHPRSDACPVCRVGQMQVQETWFAQRAARDISHPVLVCDTS